MSSPIQIHESTTSPRVDYKSSPQVNSEYTPKTVPRVDSQLLELNLKVHEVTLESSCQIRRNSTSWPSSPRVDFKASLRVDSQILMLSPNLSSRPSTSRVKSQAHEVILKPSCRLNSKSRVDSEVLKKTTRKIPQCNSWILESSIVFASRLPILRFDSKFEMLLESDIISTSWLASPLVKPKSPLKVH